MSKNATRDPRCGSRTPAAALSGVGKMRTSDAGELGCTESTLYPPPPVDDPAPMSPSNQESFK